MTLKNVGFWSVYFHHYMCSKEKLNEFYIFRFYFIFIFSVFLEINPKTAGGGSIWLPPCGFSKSVSCKERMKPWFFVTFNIIVSHIFPEDLLKLLKSFRRYEGFPWQYQPIFINLHQFFGFFYISLLQRKVKVSKSNINTD